MITPSLDHLGRHGGHAGLRPVTSVYTGSLTEKGTWTCASLTAGRGSTCSGTRGHRARPRAQDRRHHGQRPARRTCRSASLLRCPVRVLVGVDNVKVTFAAPSSCVSLPAPRRSGRPGEVAASSLMWNGTKDGLSWDPVATPRRMLPPLSRRRRRSAAVADANPDSCLRATAASASASGWRRLRLRFAAVVARAGRQRRGEGPAGSATPAGASRTAQVRVPENVPGAAPETEQNSRSPGSRRVPASATSRNSRPAASAAARRGPSRRSARAPPISAMVRPTSACGTVTSITS